MNITLRQLQVFESVARHLSFTRAAEELYLTQPAVSMQIKQLEQQVGLPLFEQIGKRIYLTEAGEEVRRYAQRISAELRELADGLEALRGLNSGRLRLTVASTANYFATDLLAAFTRRQPGVTFQLEVTNREGVIRRIQDNEMDLAVMGRPPEGLDVAAEAFMPNPLVIIAAPDHPLADGSPIPLERLQDELFVLREQGSGTRNAVQRVLEERGMNLRGGLEMSSNEAIKQSVQAGLGLGVVSIHTVALELELGRLRVLNVEGFPLERQWYLVHRSGKRLSPAAEAFRQFILDEAHRHWQVPETPGVAPPQEPPLQAVP
ncbi:MULTISPECIES: LysR family transcriptional regulator [Halorhodospira]|uniref:Transcriptional regulator, LysR family n=1 Tax=Halorhodospira halophila (strain DSM 244 / SL1) TaxID=349124 RepID=A1WVW1_HALHL|nr:MULTISPECIES: LysR family transcriptional regulator [Halorhodospira]ABM61823.1 transcriptional regulator, LysR family [Halorhodospira halophila SL1]MBK1728849.1 LysR family transcriptional regulator [Halorhodospira halophila]MBK5937400.1 LysR family transcriptional regulator [Halorhodospira halophila]MBK5943425.1 LysR family transcriptional regulator [Halorhodospira halophila]MCC3751173.1 LysR family transcriptional regulator [Halorhodospira halophila]